MKKDKNVNGKSNRFKIIAITLVVVLAFALFTGSVLALEQETIAENEDGIIQEVPKKPVEEVPEQPPVPTEPVSTEVPDPAQSTHPEPTPSVLAEPTPVPTPIAPIELPKEKPSLDGLELPKYEQLPSMTPTPSPSPSATPPVLNNSTAPTFSSSALERSMKYMQYKNEIYLILQSKMDFIKESFNTKVDSIAALLKVEDYKKLNRVPDFYADTDDISQVKTYSIEETQDFSITNWGDILAVYIAVNEVNIADPLDIENLKKISFDKLSDVFTDMNTLTYEHKDNNLNILLARRSAQEMVEYYKMTPEQQVVLEELLQPEFQSVFASLTGNTAFSQDFSDEHIAQIRSMINQELTFEREQVVLTAYSLLGKVNYFWGGKSSTPGWNTLWGTPMVVSSPGSSTTGTTRLYGLDCSGFVTWAFVNAYSDTSLSAILGEGTTNQWGNSVSVGWDEAQPGDLAFYHAPDGTGNHVGIVVSRGSDGSCSVIHCSSSNNNVIISDAWSGGFRYIRRPAVFVNENS